MIVKKILEDVYYKISKHIVELAKEGDLVYAVPGHPRVAENSRNNRIYG